MRNRFVLSFFLVVGCSSSVQKPSSNDATTDAGMEVGADSGSNDASQRNDFAIDASPDIAVTVEERNFSISSFQTALNDPERDREVGAFVYYPVDSDDAHQVVFVSHGGLGNQNGESRLTHIGTALAGHGFIAIHVGHRPSVVGQHRQDRPADVSFLIDAVESGALSMPDDFVGTFDLSAGVGHTGHSAGAYTSHAIGGAVYPNGEFRDQRVVAIAPISPQGVGSSFNAYDNGPEDNTWVHIDLPTFSLVGGDELDTTATGEFVREGWRLEPFDYYTDEADHLQVVIPGRDHSEMGSFGDDALNTFVGENLARFFLVYLSGLAFDRCETGALASEGLNVQRDLIASPGSQLQSCIE